MTMIINNTNIQTKIKKMNISLFENQQIFRGLRAAGAKGKIEVFLTPAGQQAMAKFTILSNEQGGASHIRFGQAQYAGEAKLTQEWVQLRTHKGKVESMQPIGRLSAYIENAEKFQSIELQFELDQYWNITAENIALLNGPDGYFLSLQ